MLVLWWTKNSYLSLVSGKFVNLKSVSVETFNCFSYTKFISNSIILSDFCFSLFLDKLARLTLSLVEYLRYIGSNEHSRCIVEGEEVLNAGHIILHGKTFSFENGLKLCAVCLQTSALQAHPHEIFGELLIQNKEVLIKIMHCSCKAGAGGRCKHISAFLLLLTRYVCICTLFK